MLEAYVPENFIGWWWRVVYAKFLKLRRWFHIEEISH